VFFLLFVDQSSPKLQLSRDSCNKITKVSEKPLSNYNRILRYSKLLKVVQRSCWLDSSWNCIGIIWSERSDKTDISVYNAERYRPKTHSYAHMHIIEVSVDNW